MTILYKVLRPFEWDEFQKNKIFKGSAHDLRDGFIHLSLETQLEFVINNFFQDENQIYILSFDKLDNIKWEEASNGEKFPHLYDTLKIEEILEVRSR